MAMLAEKTIPSVRALPIVWVKNILIHLAKADILILKISEHIFKT